MRNIITKYTILILIYFTLGIISTWPLFPNITTQIPNNISTAARHTYQWGDHLQIIAGFKEHKDSLTDLFYKKTIYDKEFCFYETQECTTNSVGIIKRVFFSAYWPQTILLALFNNTELAYNLGILLSYILTGISAFLFTRQILFKHTYSHNKSTNLYHTAYLPFIASLIPVLAPLRIHQMLVGHKNGYLFWVLILIMYLFERIIQQKKVNKWLYPIISILLFYLALNEQFLMLLGFGYIFARLLWVEIIENKLQVFSSIKIFINKFINYSWIIIAFAVSYGFNAIEKLSTIQNSNTSGGRSIEEITLYSPQIYDIFNKYNTEHELNLYLGIGALIIFIALIYTLLISVKNKDNKIANKLVDEIIFFLIVFFSILFISLGTTTPFYELLYDKISIFRFGRTPIRYAFILFPLISAIYALLSLQLIKKFPKFAIPYIVISIITILLSFLTFRSISLTTLPGTLDNNSLGKKILFIPYTQPDNFFGSIYEYYISDTDSVSTNGYTPFITDTEQKFYQDYATNLNKGEINDEIIKELNEYEIDTIVLLKNYFGQTNYDLPEDETIYENISKIKSALSDLNSVKKISEDETVVIWQINGKE